MTIDLEAEKETIRNEFDDIKSKFAPHIQVIIERLESLEARITNLENKITSQ